MAKHRPPAPPPDPLKGMRPRAYAWISVLNLTLFCILAAAFSGSLHHHWIVPAFCGSLLLEAGAASSLRVSWSSRAGEAVLAWILMTALVLLWRQVSMIECPMRCEIRLAMGLFFLGNACGFLARDPAAPPFMKKALTGLRVVFLAWMLGALAVRPLRGHLSSIPY